MGLYCTNDEKGKYFPDRFYVDVCISEEEYDTGYFPDLQSVYEWLEYIFDVQVRSMQDVNAIVEQRQKECAEAYCHIHEYQISE